MSDILETMENIDIKNESNDPENESIESFNLFEEDDKPKVDERNQEIIDKRLGSKFAELERREKAIEEKLARVEQFESARQKASDKGEDNDFATLAKLKESAEQDPMKVLEELGLSYEKITEHILKNKDPEKEKLVKEVDEFASKKFVTKEELEAERKKELDKQEEMQYNEYIDTLTDKLSKNEELSHLNAMGAHQRVVDLIQKYIIKHGVGENNIKGETLEDIELKAAKAVNQALKQDYEALRSKLDPAKSQTTTDTITNSDRALSTNKRQEIDELDTSERKRLAAKIIEEGWNDNDDEL